MSFILDLFAPKPGAGADGATVDDVDGVGETDVLGSGDGAALGARGAAVVDIAVWTSAVDICFDRDDIAHPARTPAAPVAELTRPAWPEPFCADVVVIGPMLADDSVCTVSGWMSACTAPH